MQYGGYFLSVFRNFAASTKYCIYDSTETEFVPVPDERAEQGGGTGGGGKADTLRQRRDGKDGELPQDGLGAGQGEGRRGGEEETGAGILGGRAVRRQRARSSKRAGIDGTGIVRY